MIDRLDLKVSLRLNDNFIDGLVSDAEPTVTRLTFSLSLSVV